VVGDDGGGVEEERQAVCLAVTIEGFVVRDFRSADDHGAVAGIDGATEALAAIGAVAAHGLVLTDRDVQKGSRTASDIDATAEAVAAVGSVVRQTPADDHEDSGTRDAAARTQAGTARSFSILTRSWGGQWSPRRPPQWGPNGGPVDRPQLGGYGRATSARPVRLYRKKTPLRSSPNIANTVSEVSRESERNSNPS